MAFWGGKVVTSNSVRSLWTCSNLSRLTLECIFRTRIKVEHIEVGLQNLRSAAITALTFPHHLGSIYSEGIFL